MRNRKTTLLLCAIGLAVTAAGCGQKNADTPPVETPVSAASAPVENQTTVKAYFADLNATKLVQKDVPIRYIKDEEKYLAALQTLTQSPGDDAVSLCPNFTFHTAKLASGTLTVDLSFPAEDRLGSGGEELLLDALKKTLFQFEEVMAFELLVDGKQTESLMGHLELLHPFKR